MATTTDTTGACCPPGSLGMAPAASSSALVGEALTLPNGLEAYVTPAGALASKTAGKKVIVNVPDIWGVSSSTHRQIADHLAQQTGHPVLVFDAWLGDAWPEAKADIGKNMDSFVPWLKRNFNPGNPEVVAAVEAVKAYLVAHGVEAFAWYGFCGGCNVGTLLSQSTTPAVKGAVAVHSAYPALANTGGPSYDALFGAAKCPHLIIPAGNDNGKETRETIPAIIRDKAKQECRVVPFEDQVHGFVPRGDLSDAKVVAGRDAALKEMAAFFSTVLGGKSKV